MSGKRSTKTVALREWKAIDEAQGTFEGYLSVFGNEDRNGDVCERGCFTKTLREAREVKDKTGNPFIFPLLWMHDEANPVGGFTSMVEDNVGLKVAGQCDMSVEWGRRAYSGMSMGYMRKLSIGYNTIKATRDQKGVRHLLEVKLWEGSAVTTGFEANTRADILNTKTVDPALASLQATLGTASNPQVCGKSSWPIALAETGWNADEAAVRLVAWATNEDESLDETKLRSVFLWYDADNAGNSAAYHLPICDMTPQGPIAIPSALVEAAVLLDTKRNRIPSQLRRKLQDRLTRYYKRMSVQFEDAELETPWETRKKAMRLELEEKQMGGLMTITTCLSRLDYYGDYLDMMLEMIGDACGMNLDPDEGDEDEGDGGGSSSVIEGMEVQPAVRALLDNLDGFGDALLRLGDAFQAFDDATDEVLTLLGMDSSNVSDEYMAARTLLEVKEGRTLSATNLKKLGDMRDSLQGHCDTIKDMIGSVSGKTAVRPGLLLKSQRPQPELRATTEPELESPEPELSATTQATELEAGLTQLLMLQSVEVQQRQAKKASK